MIGKFKDCLYPLYVPLKSDNRKFLRVRCGHCIYCKLYRRSNWSLRLELESQYWRNCSFLTLTYDDEHLPYHVVDSRIFLSDEEIKQNPEYNYVYVPSLNSRDLNLFIKQLRKSEVGEEHDFFKNDPELGYYIERRVGFRYYAVGEYGTLKGRPHLHILLFGVAPTRENAELIRKKWSKGHILLKPAFPETCKYVAGYIQKKLYGDNEQLTVKLPEFMRCSQHLGLDWLREHKGLFDDEHQFIPYKGKDGKSYPHGLPRYFREWLVKHGIIKEVKEMALYDMQMVEYQYLSDAIRAMKTTERDYFRARRIEAEHIQRLTLHKRNLTGDI